MSTRAPDAVVRKVTTVYDGFLKVNEYEIDVDRHAGGTQRVNRLVMERGQAVGVLGYDAVRDAVVLASELRPGMLAAGEYPFADALVAGGIGPDESAIEAAVREMKEEADLELRQPEVIHAGAYVSPGGTSEKIVLVFGAIDTSRAGGVFGNADEHEDIRISVVSAGTFIDRCRRGDITDLKTALAGYWLAEHRDRLRAAGR